ncbi:24111_t:CDS:2 [Dentiscutata erythropus]|uniref:24111_t:CDS:1 n=1 Tax=Dentiscutata erythropus TaxID=1348616 RepID=A0A9N9GVL5_9GLOM|nr:24111_t:CDS:2 [Dentiscutata erythropus]
MSNAEIKLYNHSETYGFSNQLESISDVKSYDFFNFKELKHLGNGGFTLLYSCVYQGEKYALKELNNNYLDNDKFKKILSELKLVDHPNIIKFYGISKSPQCNFMLVLQYANGGNLQDYLRSKQDKNEYKTSWTELIQFAKDITNGLAYLHANDIIHQNLKVAKNKRERTLTNIPPDYVKLYERCWLTELENRPTLENILIELERLSIETSIEFINVYEQHETFQSISYTPTEKIEKVESTHYNSSKENETFENNHNNSSKENENFEECKGIWENDDDVKECRRCQKPFMRLYRRKHHCRRCGQVVCNQCSRERVTLSPDQVVTPSGVGMTSESSHRICSSCHDLMTAGTATELNILLLGETGVGKSTFINAFANYMKFKNIDEAMRGKMDTLIPSLFSIADEYCELKNIMIGQDDENESITNRGMSSTQGCRSYKFRVDNNTEVRFIDTPGIGDTRGVYADEQNFENILKYISQFEHLNGICILLKPNNARLTVMFRFCIQELLSHLHKDARDNIVFCFTNCRGTFYRPGDTLPALKKQLMNLKSKTDVEIKTEQNTLYCFDNESFRFLAAYKQYISFNEIDKEIYAGSWKRSVDESNRLIRYFKSCRPHIVKDTISLNNARQIVMSLSKPLAEICQNIQVNIALSEEKREEIKKFGSTIADLEGKLHIPQIDLEPVQLNFPRTVCTSASCVKTLTIGKTEMKKIDYITHCHKQCYLRGVECNLINNTALMECSAMNGTDKCQVCGCSWNKHMHITYENQQVSVNKVDENIQSLINEKQSDQTIKAAYIKDLENRINQLKEEKNTINKIIIQFALFLRQNAIAAFNDAYIDYFDHFINEEKIKKAANPMTYNNDILDELETSRREYAEKMETIKDAIEADKASSVPITPEDINNLEKQLYHLTISGQTLQKMKDEAKRGQINAMYYQESLRNNNNTSRFSNSMRQIFSPRFYKLI